MHQGMTSSDVRDATVAVQMAEASDMILKDLHDLREVIERRAHEFKRTPMIGRSHGIHAEPITFGLKLALMWDEFGRAEERLQAIQPRLRVGKLSGAAGTHAPLPPPADDKGCPPLC